MTSVRYVGLTSLSAAAIAAAVGLLDFQLPAICGLVAAALFSHLVIRYRPSPLLVCFVLATSILFVSRSTLAPAALTALILPVCTLILLTGVLIQRSTIEVPRLFPCLLGANVPVVLSSWWFGASGLQLKSLLVFGLAAAFMFVGANLGALELRRAFIVLLCVAVAEAAIGIMEGPLGVAPVRTFVAATLDGNYIVRPNTILGDAFNRVQGTVGYPIPFAHLMVVGLSLILALRVRRPLSVWLGVVLIVAILFSGSRSGLFGAATLLVVWATFGGRDRLPKLSIPIAAGSAAAVAGMNYLSRLQEESDFSFVHRAGVIESARNLLDLSLARVLIGNGIDAQEYLFSDQVLTGTQTWAIDNAFVTTLAYGGVIALASILWVIVVVARGGRRNVVLFLPFVSMFIFYDAFQWYGFAGLFWFFAGALVSSSSTNAELEPQMDKDGARNG